MLSLFDDSTPAEEPAPKPVMMSDAQRSHIRALFEVLEIRTASEQFDFVAGATGTCITSVADLDGATAHRLIARLTARTAHGGRVSTGNSWDARTEDTWIDKL